MNKFEIISEQQYNKDFDGYKASYASLKIPKRATRFSAGYDIFSPIDFKISPGESVKFPTGIRVKLDEDKFLLIVPRSGLGFKYRLQLDNTTGVIDADYYGSDNEGHIWVKLTNDSRDGKCLEVRQGDAVAQGIILQYNLVVDDTANECRNGGFGSTTK